MGECGEGVDAGDSEVRGGVRAGGERKTAASGGDGKAENEVCQGAGVAEDAVLHEDPVGDIAVEEAGRREEGRWRCWEC